MEFLILGPLAVRGASGDVSLGGNKPRGVLAVLLLHPNQPVSAERLALALWGEDAPGAAVKTVQVHVSRLRKALGDPAVLTTTQAGYSLRVREGELDAERFEDLVEDARRAMADGQAESAAASLREALALWRGPALAELVHEPFAAAEIARLQEQRLAALELRIEADLAICRHAEVVGELQRLVADNPLREQLAGQLMLALYRCGRQTEALEAYASARRTLVEEMGIEPGPQLRERHEAILRQDAALQAKTADAQLPAALDPANAQPLVGRDDELGWLLARWQVARNGGGGAVVALAGPRGAGKTRLVAELARSIHRPGVTILHASGDGPADSTLVALRRAREATTPTLLVVDDADRAGAGVRSELARVESQLAGASVLVVISAEEPAAITPLHPARVLELGPIGEDAVREIAGRYAPSGAAADVPADWLLEASDGMPRRVHEAASQWARREAARHVGAVADRAETGRAELRSLEAELAGGVADLQDGRKRFERGNGDDPPVVCPFKGLATFDAVDARYFFGRERLVAELVARLVGAPLLAIVGPSGSGKSSVMRAGLLPALASGVLPESGQWPQVVVRPGRHPVRELATALADVDGDRRTVLAIDQFEEVFTVCDDEDERAEFIAELVHAALDPRRRYVVVIALRADCYGSCAAYPQLPALLAENNVLVGAMARDELRRAVEGPCERARLSIEPELVDALVGDVEREPGGLPLLSASLLELWQHRDGRRLRHGSYAQTGGVHGAVARLAEDAFAQLDEGQQAVGRSVLMRLVGTGDGGALERRRIALDDLDIARDEDAARVIALLTDRRLLTVGAGSIELAHEALLREWPRLRGWIEEDRDGLRIQRGLSIAAEEWDRLQRDPGALYRGGRLTEAVEWRDDRGPALSALERGFLASSAEAQQREQVTRRRRGRVLLAAGAVAMLAIVAVAVAAWFAQRERGLTASRQLASQSASTVGADPALALTLARAALDRAGTPEARGALRQATLADRAMKVVPAHKGEGTSVDANAGGSTVVSAGEDGKVRSWRAGDLQGGRTLTTHEDTASSVALSPDGERVASSSHDGTIALTPIAGGASRTLRAFPTPDKERGYRVDMTDDVVVAGTNAGGVWILPTAERARPYVLGRHANASNVVVAVGPDGKTVFSADNWEEGFLWDVKTRTPAPVQVKTAVYAASFSTAGKLVAAAGDDGHLRVWSVATGALVKDVDLGDRQIFSVRFSGDDRRVVTASDDHVVQIVDIVSGQEISRMAGGSAIRAVFTARGGVVSVGADGALQAWAPLDVKVPKRPAHRPAPTLPSFGRGSTQVVSGDIMGGVHVWDLERGRERTLPGHETADYPASSLAAASADGKLVVSVAVDGTAHMYDLARDAPRKLALPEIEHYALAVSTTGRIAVAGGEDERGRFAIVVQDLDGANPIQLAGHTDPIHALDFSADGTHLVSGSGDGTARIWDLEKRTSRVLNVDASTVRGVSYGDDGRVLTAGADGTIRVWPAGGGDPVVLVGHEGPVSTAELNRRGDRIVSTGLDGTVRIWDAAGGDTLVVLVRHKGSEGSGAAFSPDGRYVVSSGEDGLRVTRCEVCDGFGAVKRLAATRAPRPLTASERERRGL